MAAVLVTTSAERVAAHAQRSLSTFVRRLLAAVSAYKSNALFGPFQTA